MYSYSLLQPLTKLAISCEVLIFDMYAKCMRKQFALYKTLMLHKLCNPNMRQFIFWTDMKVFVVVIFSIFEVLKMNLDSVL